MSKAVTNDAFSVATRIDLPWMKEDIQDTTPHEVYSHDGTSNLRLLELYQAEAADPLGSLPADRSSWKVDQTDTHGATVLHHACFRGYKELAEALVDAGSQVNTRDKAGHTPLMLVYIGIRGNPVDVAAAKAENLRRIQIAANLLANGAKVEVTDTNKRTAIHHAFASTLHQPCDPNDKVGVVRAVFLKRFVAPLLAACEEERVLDKKDNRDNTALMHLLSLWSESFSWSCIQPLHDAIRCAAELGVALHDENVHQFTPLMLALKTTSAQLRQSFALDAIDSALDDVTTAQSHYVNDVVRLLLSFKLKTNTSSKSRDTPLHIIASVQTLVSSDFVERFIADGVDINAVNDEGKTPLEYCLYKTCTSAATILRARFTFEALAGNGARAASQSSAAHFVSKHANVELLRGAVNAKVDLNAPDSSTQCAPIHYAALSGDKDVVDILVANGANINALDHKGNTALNLAAVTMAGAANSDNIQFNGLDICAQLQSHGCRIDHPNEKNNTALHLLCIIGPKIDSALADLVNKQGQLQNGQLRNYEHQTYLMLAAAHGMTQTTRAICSNLPVNDCKEVIDLGLIDGSAAIIQATEANAADVVLALITYGAAASPDNAQQLHLPKIVYSAVETARKDAIAWKLRCSRALAFRRQPNMVPDADTKYCLECKARFLISRRHHCRFCGFVFCGSCSSHQLELPAFGFTSAVRVCDSCNTAVRALKLENPKSEWFEVYVRKQTSPSPKAQSSLDSSVLDKRAAPSPISPHVLLPSPPTEIVMKTSLHTFTSLLERAREGLVVVGALSAIVKDEADIASPSQQKLIANIRKDPQIIQDARKGLEHYVSQSQQINVADSVELDDYLKMCLESVQWGLTLIYQYEHPDATEVPASVVAVPAATTPTQTRKTAPTSSTATPSKVKPIVASPEDDSGSDAPGGGTSDQEVDSDTGMADTADPAESEEAVTDSPVPAPAQRANAGQDPEEYRSSYIASTELRAKELASLLEQAFKADEDQHIEAINRDLLVLRRSVARELKTWFTLGAGSSANALAWKEAAPKLQSAIDFIDDACARHALSPERQLVIRLEAALQDLQNGMTDGFSSTAVLQQRRKELEEEITVVLRQIRDSETLESLPKKQLEERVVSLQKEVFELDQALNKHKTKKHVKSSSRGLKRKVAAAQKEHQALEEDLFDL